MFASRSSSNFANARNSADAGQQKNFAGHGPKGVSVRIFKQPSHSSYPYTASAHFDVDYHPMDTSHQSRRTSWFNMIPEPAKHFHFPGHNTSTSRRSPETHHQPKSSSFSIIPGLSKDRFIYEASNSEFSSSTTSLTPLPFSPALSSDSTDTVLGPESPIDTPHPSQNRPPSRSSTTPPAPNGPHALAQAQSSLRDILRDPSQPHDLATNSARSSQLASFPTSQPQSQQSYIPFMASEPSPDLEHVSRMSGDYSSAQRYGEGRGSANPIAVEPRDIPTQIYRDMPLRNSPEAYDAPVYPPNTGPGNVRESSPTFSNPFKQSPPDTHRERRRSYSYGAPPIIPAPQMEPSISQSTTSTLDPHHPLLVPPPQELMPGMFEVPRSDSDGSVTTLESSRRSPPQSYARSRTDSGVNRYSYAGGGVSTSPVTLSNTGEGSPARPRVEAHGVSGTAQYHNSPPLPHTNTQQPSGASSNNSINTPATQVQSSYPPPHALTHGHTAAPGADVNIPSNAIHPPRSRPQATTIESVSSSSASERTLDDSPTPAYMLDPRQRNSSIITSAPGYGPNAPNGLSSRTRTTSLSSIAPPVFNTVPPVPTRLSPNSISQVHPPVMPIEHSSRTPSPPHTMSSSDPISYTSHVEEPYTRTRTPGPKRSHSDGDNPMYSAATHRSSTPFRTEFAPNVTKTPSSMPPPPEPRRRYSDEPQAFSRAPISSSILPPINTMAARTVRWNKDLICPSPILACHRRKGWFNRRGDQLWTNSGSYRPCAAGQEYPPDLESYPEFGDGWMNEEGTKIDMMHRLIPKMPLRSALKQTRASNHA
ncbi:hypothetical protein PQX77_020962 [Marasmius sp. AFHP31]|nr:hypothetical protein PQX77_020962 [Marasmius sp. AFHP31]